MWSAKMLRVVRDGWCLEKDKFDERILVEQIRFTDVASDKARCGAAMVCAVGCS